MIAALTPDQSQSITGLVNTQKPYLQGIVVSVSRFRPNCASSWEAKLPIRRPCWGLMKKYGELDGANYLHLAVTFTQVNQSMTGEQKAKLNALRQQVLNDMLHPTGAFLYSQPIDMPAIENTDFLFATR